MDDFELEIKKEFLNEALINLEEVEGSFMELESAADPKPLLDKIFRLAHNLKGGSRAVGFGDVAEFTHQLENLVLKIQKGDIALSSEVITTLLKSNDRLVEMLNELKGNAAATFQNQDIIEEIQGWLNGTTTAAAPAPAPVAAAAVASEVTAPPVAPVEVEVAAQAIEATPAADLPPSSDAFFGEENVTPPPPAPVSAAPQPQSAAPPAPAAPAPTPAASAPAPIPAVAAKSAPAGKNAEHRGLKEDEIIRVSLSKIDSLNDYVGELIVLQSVVQQQAAGAVSPKLHGALRQLVKLSKDIQNLSMSLRMLPVKPLVQKLQRVVRDTATVLKKDVVVEVIGEQLDIDKSVLDRLADPLIHVLRNGVDHGIEMPDERATAGKPRQGKIILSFANEGNHLVVEVKDDGKGINGEILRKKAIEKGLISENQNLTEKQLVNLIFHPGFSTKSETSEISGRGVGMDVVKTNVEGIGGNVDVNTTVGKGSIFRMQIPLSLAVIDGLVVTSDKGRYVVPLSQVQETINLRSQTVHTNKTGIGTCFELRGEVVPLISLENALGHRAEEVKPDGTALIFNLADRRMGIVVNDILRAQQIVIKPFSNGINPQKGWIGSCVLGDGLPTLIVSPTDLLRGRVVAGQTEHQTLGGAA